MEIDYTLAFMTGLLGSGHCMGMCGALVSGFFMKSEKKSVWPYFTYHLARIGMYTVVGTIAATLGYALVATGLIGRIQGFMQVLIGFLVVMLALGILGITPWQYSMKFLPTKMIHKIFLASAKRGSASGAAFGGLLNGLMPCPLTFAMAVNAASADTPWKGGLMMLALGAGTLPSMLFVTFAFGKLGARVRGLMLKCAAVVMIVMGSNTVYKGLNFLGAKGGFSEHVMALMHH
jgi:sulfite exporter TauE/SafE